MPAERRRMRQVRDVLRLKYACGHSERRIAAALGISRYTVAEYLRRAAVIGLSWPVPPALDDAALERKLFTPPGFITAEKLRPQPDWARIHAERRCPVVILRFCLGMWRRRAALALNGMRDPGSDMGPPQPN
jgi:Homeodomain-like domain